MRTWWRAALVALGVVTLASCGATSGARPTTSTASVVYHYADDTGLAPLAGSWPMFDADAARTGTIAGATTISPTTAGNLRRLWSVALPDVADSSPVLDGDVRFPDGRHGAVIYLTTKSGALVAADATTGALLWEAKTSGPQFTTSSPALDLAHQRIYSYGLDGFVHQYDAATGVEITGGNWPARITLMPTVEKESAALTIANGRLYVTTSGYPGDQGHYEGHIVAIPLSGGAPTVWNALCAGTTTLLGPTSGAGASCAEEQTGIWARAGVVVDATTGTVDVATGNGDFNGRTDWGDSVVALTPDLSHIVDSYTPTNAATLRQGDLDLGSAAPALLPPLAGATPDLLAAQAGKDGVVRLLNRRDLSSQGGPGHSGGEVASVAAPGGCQVLNQPIPWRDASGRIWLFVTTGCATVGYQISARGGAPVIQAVWRSGEGGTSPVLADGVLFAASNGAIFALDASTGREVWRSSQNAGGTIGGIHWESPIVVANRVYSADESGHLTCYALP